MCISAIGFSRSLVCSSSGMLLLFDECGGSSHRQGDCIPPKIRGRFCRSHFSARRQAKNTSPYPKMMWHDLTNMVTSCFPPVLRDMNSNPEDGAATCWWQTGMKCRELIEYRKFIPKGSKPPKYSRC